MLNDSEPNLPGFDATHFFPPLDPLRAEADELANKIFVMQGRLEIMRMSHNLHMTTEEQRKEYKMRIVRLLARYDQLREELLDRRIRWDEEFEEAQRRRTAEGN